MAEKRRLPAFAPSRGRVGGAAGRVVEDGRGRGRPPKYGVPTQAQISKALKILDKKATAVRERREFESPSGFELYCWRMHKGISTAVAASGSSVSVRTWSDWERGTTEMPIAQFVLFAIRELGLLDS